MDRFNSSQEALTNLTELLYKYDPDCRWMRGEWDHNSFTSEFTDEGMDPKEAIMLGYAIDEFFALMDLSDIHVEEVSFMVEPTPEELEALRQKLKQFNT